MNEATRTCGDCGASYTPASSRQSKYCGSKCQQRAAERRRRVRQPAVGEPIPGRAIEILTCEACGDIFDHAIRRSTTSRRYCTGRCYEWARTHPGQRRQASICVPCGASIGTGYHGAKTCGSRQCLWWHKHHPGQPLPANRLCKGCRQPIGHLAISAIFCGTACKAWVNKMYPGGERIRPLTRTCGVCGVDISDRGSRAIYCSPLCFGRSTDQAAASRAAAKRRRVRLAGGVTLPFTDEQLEQRLSMYGGCCYVCGSTERVTVDHIKPVGRGGLHGLCNFRPLCKSCNAVKADAWPMPIALLSRGGTPDERLALLRAVGREARQRRNRAA